MQKRWPPQLSFAGYGEAISADYRYNAEGVIEIPVIVDGKEIARATAPYTQAEIKKLESRSSRKRGKA